MLQKSVCELNFSESCLARLTAAVQKRSPHSSPWQGSETGLEKVEEIEARIKWICWEVLHSIYYGVRYIGSFTISLKVLLVRVNCLRVFLDELSRRGQYSMYIYFVIQELIDPLLDVAWSSLNSKEFHTLGERAQGLFQNKLCSSKEVRNYLHITG